MSLPSATTLRLFVTLSFFTALVVLLPSVPAHALDRKMFGDVVVEPGAYESGVSTSFGDVTVNGPVAGDVRSAFGDVVINHSVEGNVEAGKGDIEIHAPVQGSVDAGFGNVLVDSVVTGDVDVGHGDVLLGPTAEVRGDVYCGSGSVSGNTSAVGGTMRTGMDADFKPGPAGPFGRLIGWALATAAFAALSVLATVLAPGTLLATARRAEESPGWSLFVGIASLPAMLVISVVLVILLIGIPLALALVAAYLALLFFGTLVAAFFVGRKVLMATGRYRAGNALAAAAGALIVASVTLVPLVGDLILCALALLGTGATILALISRRPRPAYPSYEVYVRERRGS